MSILPERANKLHVKPLEHGESGSEQKLSETKPREVARRDCRSRVVRWIRDELDSSQCATTSTLLDYLKGDTEDDFLLLGLGGN